MPIFTSAADCSLPDRQGSQSHYGLLRYWVYFMFYGREMMKLFSITGLFFRVVLTGLVITGAALSLSAPAFAQYFDNGYYYRLSTQFRGNGNCLDVFNGGANNNMTHLTNCADYSGQYWRLSDAGNGYYRLSTMFRGVNMCLDIHNGGPRNNQPHLVPCANYSGQFWNIRNEGGWNRLTTQFRGAGMCLDIFNGGPSNNMPHLTGCANYSGQFWHLQQTNKRY